MRKEMLMEAEILELYGGLCREAARCELHALRAVKDGRSELVPLFKSLAISLSMQANRFMMQIRGVVSGSEETLQEVYVEIVPASLEAYEQLAVRAQQLGSRALAGGFTQSAGVQRKNISLYRQVKNDGQASEYHVCNFCGFVARNAAPENCPICSASRKRFIQVPSG